MAGFKLVGGRYLIDKDPESKLDYGVRLAKWLVTGDSLSPSIVPVWTCSSGLTIHNPGTAVIAPYGIVAFANIWGGVLYAEEWAKCHWTTVLGREEEQTLYFNMTDK